MKLKRVRPVLRWPGGKSRLLNDLLPLPDHQTYVEPLAGGLAVFLAKEPSPVEIVNDLNDELVCLYRVAQFHPDALVQELAFMIHSRKNMRDWIKCPGLTDIQRGARFLARNRSSFAGNGLSYAVVRKAGGGLPSRLKIDELLRELNVRLDRVSVENQSYERCLEVYDSPDTLFFMDPPYLHSKAKAYRGWTEAEMTEFAGRVKSLQGKWIVTVDDSPFNRELFKGYQIQALKTRNQAGNQRLQSDAVFGELIIRSPLMPAVAAKQSKFARSAPALRRAA